jgi:hypothetical protein
MIQTEISKSQTEIRHQKANKNKGVRILSDFTCKYILSRNKKSVTFAGNYQNAKCNVMMDNNRKEYITNLQKLDFEVENQMNSSVYLVSNLKEYIEQGDISSYIIIALDKAKTFDVDAVYFRFFDDERPPMAQIYIYDNINNQYASEYYAQKHREIWSSCEVSSFFIIDKEQIRVYDSRNPVKIVEDKLISNPIETIDLLSCINDVIAKYNAQNFDNGSFWENMSTKKYFLNSKIASERLIKGLKDIRNRLHQDNLLNSELIDKLLIICILIRYLEETGTDGNKNYAHDFFEKETGYRNLENIIRNNKLSCLLSALSEHFNGGIFDLDETFKQRLNDSDIHSLAQFFEAGYKNNLFGWKEYSFEHIPVELISNFYEEFIPKTSDILETREKSKKDTGAVYTPNFLVKLLIDECLPLDNLEENVKLIDPACGSGIFLVTAYKRIVQRWRIKNMTKKLSDTNPQVLKDILMNNIFGIDVNPNSVNLSIFSLQLALCSMLTPKQIWTELIFSDLRDKNIIRKDFFEYLTDENTTRDFDLVIGNPPFKQRELDGKKYEYYNELLRDDFQIRFQNSRKEFALLFLEKSMHLLENKKGKLCLILPSGPLLYAEDSSGVRKQLFAKYNVSQIIDFTLLRRVLFQSTIASLAIFVDCISPTDSPILHITARRTKQSKERFYFEFDHYDFYKFPKELVVNSINIWKCNLLGGYRVYDIIEKFNRIETKIKDFCRNSNILIQNSVKKSDVYSDEYEKSANENTLFKGEKIVLKKSNTCWGIRKKITKGNFPTEVTMNDFKENKKFDAIGFKGSAQNIEQLKRYITKHSELICFYIAAVSGRQGIRSPYVIDLSDLKNFPFSDDLDNCLTNSDKILMNDVVKYTLEEFGEGEKAEIHRKTAEIEKHIIPFSKLYCDSLNKIYAKGNERYYFSKLTEGNSFFACEYIFGNGNDYDYVHELSDKNLDDLLHSWNPSHSAKYSKIMRIYSNNGNTIRIVKPKKLLFWLQSIALRDFDDTINDVLNRK